jgi:NAD(P)-dependent dehydrogenase (short-subunit alcohol dehydrogenase family)
MDLGLDGRKVLVTGGSRGIGRAIVEAFLQEGAQVAFCARGEAGVREAEQAFGNSAIGAVLDVSDAVAVAKWVDDAAQTLGGIDIVVSNVSALAVGGDLDTWRRAMETDLLGSVSLVEAALPHLRRSDAGSIVLISSVSGREVDMFAEPYGVVKGALIHYGKALSARLASEGIRANTVSPGNVYFTDGVWGSIERDQPAVFAQCLAANPTGRMAQPEEIARATVFIASPASSFTTGANLLVDGGLSHGVQF